MEIGPIGLTILMLAPIFMILIVSLAGHIKRKTVSDVWNLKFRRARTVRADMKTTSNRTITRYVVPDLRGFFRHKNGIYHFPATGFDIDGRYGIPMASFLEGQIEDEAGKLVVAENEIEVPGHGKIKVPQYMITHAGLRPKLLKLARRDDKGKIIITDEPPVTSLEVADLMDSKIVNDITNASLADLQLGRIFIAVLIVGGLVVIGLIWINSNLGGLRETMEAGFLATNP